MIASRAVVRAVGRTQNQQKRGIVDYLTKYPDKVMEIKKVQMAGGTRLGENNPTWLKQPGDKAVLAFGAALTTFGCAQLCVGYYRLAAGVGKKD
eukprot:CAMPEP_0178917798 /NCGR_PEP_ID=MMETSP0786-20121207/13452_1 /TAXON_ID=186022 /ORGANISM="Thalassionema frauenfeldii, Strain CCMP 1798" /LENGTH=93 /DNA_ID=CAMNT_0020591399 /DNA_START=106 /DNA_END=387 /DNA_ORIENTATION=-